MPLRGDLKKVLVVGSGPIVIGQACEFDYSGTQAVKALKEEGIEVVLLNSNPATIMTDPGLAHRTYVEPITPGVAEAIIAKERPQALLPTMGGQTALNLARTLHEKGVLEKYGVELIGARADAIDRAEDRLKFKEAMQRIGVPMPRSAYARSFEEAARLVEEIGFPAVLRPSFTLGGTGGGIAWNREEFDRLIVQGLRASANATVLIEESVLGWKEYELEVVRDSRDNCIVVCSIENVDPMGVHTGDSITVAPAQTLTDKEYQRLRDAAFRIIREIGVDTGGSNIQFAVNPADGRYIVIEMNPRVSRSSALASKATGYPIARVATKLAIGYTLDELENDITRDTVASFEPTLDYVVVKIPRFNFEKFPSADRTLTTTMRSVGEVMAIGRDFTEAYAKALRSMEAPFLAFETPDLPAAGEAREMALAEALRVPRPERPWYVAQALREGWTVAQVADVTKIDPWFLSQIGAAVRAVDAIAAKGPDALDGEALRAAKNRGLSDRVLAKLVGLDEAVIRARRKALGLVPAYQRVDTCAAEFEAVTPYLYSSWGGTDEAPPTDRQKVMILGSGPIRIGQGIEFDTCCVEACFALKQAGFETIMVNCNPETVSTDFDTSDRLYFEPLTVEDVLAIAEREQPLGAIVQFGGQTPLRIAGPLQQAGLEVLGTPPDAIDRAEDRERFAALMEKLKLKQPENGVARSPAEAYEVARRIGFPVMVRPSYVLGGRAMEVVYDEASLERYMKHAVEASPEHPVLIDRFLKDAVEVDLDLIADKTGAVFVGGLLEHIQEAGVHSGDAACTLPPHSLSPELVERMKDQAGELARELGVVGLMNVQFAVQGKAISVLEVNPRASRTVPFVAKATGVPLARVAALCMLGKTLKELGVTREVTPAHKAVKEAVFPFARFNGVDVLLGPEMKSTGEVMGLARDWPEAFAKAQHAAGVTLPKTGRAFISVKDDDKPAVVDLAKRLIRMGFTVVATGGTQRYLEQKGVEAQRVLKVTEGRPSAVDGIVNGKIHLVINTTVGRKEVSDSFSIRRESLMHAVPYYTTVQAGRMAVEAIEAISRGRLEVHALQELLGALR